MGWVLLGILGGGVPPGSLNPDLVQTKTCHFSYVYTLSLDKQKLRQTKAVLFGELKAQEAEPRCSKEAVQGPRNKKQLSLADIPPNSWQGAAGDRLTWRSTIRKASREFEIQRSSAVREKRQRWQDRALSQIPASQSSAFICP